MATLIILGFFQSPLNRLAKCSHVIDLNKSTGAHNLEPKRYSLAARSNISPIFHLKNLGLVVNEPLLIHHPDIFWLHTLERVTAAYNAPRIQVSLFHFYLNFLLSKVECHVALWDVLSVQYGFRTIPPFMSPFNKGMDVCQ